jgi:hypothetical protein
VRRDPAAERLTGDEPVPVVMEVDPVIRLGDESPDSIADTAGGLFTAACPQTSQYPSSIVPEHPGR